MSKKAMKWLKKAADNEDVDSLTQLGIIYLEDSNEESRKKGVEMLEKAASLRGDYAAYTLGSKYFSGEGVEVDRDKAFKYLKDASDYGNDSAQYYLGYIIESGLFKEELGTNPMPYYEKSAAYDNPKALFRLAHIYATGMPFCEKDEIKAFNYYIKACEVGNIQPSKIIDDLTKSGDTDSTFFLACCYLNGIGVVKNDIIAYELMKQAAADGNKNAKIVLEQMDNVINSELKKDDKKSKVKSGTKPKSRIKTSSKKIKKTETKSK